MELHQVISFAFVASLLVISPGPNGLLVARTVPTSGKRAGFAVIAGFVPAFFIHGSLSIFGLSVILMRSANWFLAAKIAGAAYLCWIGIRALIQACRTPTETVAVSPARSVRSAGTAFADGFLTNLLNPKVSIFYLAAFPQFVPASETGIFQAIALVSVHAILAISWFSAMIILFDRLFRFATNGSIQRWVHTVTGFVFVGFGYRLLTFER